MAEPYPRSGIDEARRFLSTIDACKDADLVRGVVPAALQARGDPAEILITIPVNRDAEIQRVLLRSVSSHVVRESACDVLVVR